MEHRWGERLKVTLPVRVRAPFGVIGAGLVLDFSVSGAFIATTLPVALLSRVEISFRSARRGVFAVGRHLSNSTFTAQVVRMDAAGFAVEWQEFGSEDVVAFATANRGTSAPSTEYAEAR